MSALDDLFDGHYFTDDPHVYIPIDEARKELAAIRTENARLQKAVDDAEKALKPFAKEDLAKIVGGNVEGGESVVYQKVNTQLKIKHFVNAINWLKEYGKG